MFNDNSTNGVSLASLFPQSRFHFAEDIRVTSCCTDAELCRDGDLFVAPTVDAADSDELARKAVQRGAAAILAERLLPVQVPQCLVTNTNQAFSRLCHTLVGNPSQALPVVGIAGHHGKAATQALLRQVLKSANQSPALFGHSVTTDRGPGADLRFHSPSHYASWLSRASVGGYSHALTELPRDAVVRHGFAGVQLRSLVLTGLSSSTHKNVASPKTRTYVNRLLGSLRPGGVVVANIDCPVVRDIVGEISHPTLTVSTEYEADVTATRLEQELSEQTFLVDAGEQTSVVRTRIVGDAQLQNALLAIASGLGMGLDLSTAVAGVERVQAIAGRLERIECGQSFSVFADAAVSAQQIRRALVTLRELTSGRIICVFGQGEKPKPELRSLRGRIVERYADMAVITSDNVRDREPLFAAHDVLDGFAKPARAHVVPNRTQAIRFALENAKPGDTVVLAGPHNRFENRGDDDFPSDGDVARFCMLTQDESLRECLAAAKSTDGPTASLGPEWN